MGQREKSKGSWLHEPRRDRNDSLQRNRAPQALAAALKLKQLSLVALQQQSPGGTNLDKSRLKKGAAGSVLVGSGKSAIAKTMNTCFRCMISGGMLLQAENLMTGGLVFWALRVMLEIVAK